MTGPTSTATDYRTHTNRWELSNGTVTRHSTVAMYTTTVVEGSTYPWTEMTKCATSTFRSVDRTAYVSRSCHFEISKGKVDRLATSTPTANIQASLTESNAASQPTVWIDVEMPCMECNKKGSSGNQDMIGKNLEL